MQNQEGTSLSFYKMLLKNKQTNKQQPKKKPFSVNSAGWYKDEDIWYFGDAINKKAFSVLWMKYNKVKYNRVWEKNKSVFSDF